MSLDVYLFKHKEIPDSTPSYGEKDSEESEELYWANITHNLGEMAKEAGIYQALWRPEEIGATQAKDIIDIVDKGLLDLIARPSYYERFDSPNGWGTYKHFVPFVAKYLEALKKYPESYIYVSR
jgi:hypothetical protein